MESDLITHVKQETSPRLGNAQRLLSVPEAASMLNVSHWTLRQWLSQRRIPFVKVGRLTKLRPQDIQAFIDAHVQKAIAIE